MSSDKAYAFALPLVTNIRKNLKEVIRVLRSLPPRNFVPFSFRDDTIRNGLNSNSQLAQSGRLVRNRNRTSLITVKEELNSSSLAQNEQSNALSPGLRKPRSISKNMMRSVPNSESQIVSKNDRTSERNTPLPATVLIDHINPYSSLVKKSSGSLFGDCTTHGSLTKSNFPQSPSIHSKFSQNQSKVQSPSTKVLTSSEICRLALFSPRNSKSKKSEFERFQTAYRKKHHKTFSLKESLTNSEKHQRTISFQSFIKNEEICGIKKVISPSVIKKELSLEKSDIEISIADFVHKKRDSSLTFDMGEHKSDQLPSPKFISQQTIENQRASLSNVINHLILKKKQLAFMKWRFPLVMKRAQFCFEKLMKNSRISVGIAIFRFSLLSTKIREEKKKSFYSKMTELVQQAKKASFKILRNHKFMKKSISKEVVIRPRVRDLKLDHSKLKSIVQMKLSQSSYLLKKIVFRIILKRLTCGYTTVRPIPVQKESKEPAVLLIKTTINKIFIKQMMYPFRRIMLNSIQNIIQLQKLCEKKVLYERQRSIKIMLLIAKKKKILGQILWKGEVNIVIALSRSIERLRLFPIEEPKIERTFSFCLQ